MKKLALIISLIAGFFSSCKKDYTCTCTTTQSNGVLVGTRTVTITDTKKKAEAACKAGNENTPISNGFTTTTDCVIK